MFRLVTPLIVIDLEATAGKDALGFQTNDEILDIGAVFLDEGLSTKGEYSSLVKVQGTVTPFITKLTGIRSEDIASEKPWLEVGAAFQSWAQELSGGKLKQCRLAAWGAYFDIPLLRRNYQQIGVEFPFSGTALDVKSLAFLRQSLSGGRTDKLDLEALARELGLSVPEQRHRALPDAQLTSRVLVKLWEELQGFWISGKPSEPWRHFHVAEDHP